MSLVTPIPSVIPKRTAMPDRVLPFLQGAIDLGSAGTIRIFERLHAAAAARDASEMMAGCVSAADLMEAIDRLVPQVNGERVLSREYDSDSVVSNPSQGNTATMVLAAIELEAWKQLPDTPLIDDIICSDVYHAVKHLDVVARYLPVTPEPEANDTCDMTP